MKRTLVSLGLACLVALSVSGCISAGASTSPAVTPAPSVTTQTSGSELVSQVQTVTAQACGFLPVAQTVIGLFNTNGRFSTVSEVASAICGAVTKRTVAHGGVKTPTVAKVPIRGRFV